MQKKFWVLYGLTVLGAGIFAYHYFEKAIPFVKVPITMDHHEAVQQAKLLAEKNNIDLHDYQVATRYTDSRQLQAFVELEAGGKQAFIDMIEHNDYQPYAWHVRFFKEKEVREVFFAFTPTGKPYEFVIKLPENLKGAALSKDQAYQIALQGASDWQLDLKNYELIEHNTEELPSGRIDHAFTYQRGDIVLGAAFYRIQLKVSGDLFSCLNRSVKIPDEFHRRYAQMFSLNRTVAGFARNIGTLLYLFIFGLFSLLFFVYRKNGLAWKYVAQLTIICAMLFSLNAFNNWPLIWFGYQTHLSGNFFAFQMMLIMILNIVLVSLLVGFVALIAEAAGRYLFGKHLQFFKLWTSGVAGSYQVLEQTLIGYGFAIILFGYVIAFYYISSKFGWWVPLSTLMDPNILSSRFPSVSPLITAFQAGFLEEFLFRALPLAGILLIARNSVHKNSWFGVVFVLQVIIFGALHANYPQQPAYFRIVELIFDGCAWGLLYYLFGLFPGIISHFVYDALFMSLPIFVSQLYFQKIISIFVILIPLLIVFVAWLLQGRKLKNAPADAYNQACKIGNDALEHAVIKHAVGQIVSLRLRCIALIFGVVGLIMLSFSDKFKFNAPPMQITVTHAEQIANESVEREFGVLGKQWVMTYRYENPENSMGGKYIWQTFGEQAYQTLQNSYIALPAYVIKFVTFEGAVEDRSEFFEVMVQADGSVSSMTHNFPEGWAGADLSEQQAQDFAYALILKKYGIARDETEFVSSHSVKHAQRRDWSIVLKDIKNYNLPTGQGRILVKICGDQLAHVERFVHAPEEWQREEQNRNTQNNILHFILQCIIYAWCFVFLCIAMYKFGFSSVYFVPFIALVISYLVMKCAVVALSWFNVLYYFASTETFGQQIFNLVGNTLTGGIALGSVITVFCLSAIGLSVRAKQKNIFMALPLGIALGVGVFGLLSLVRNFAPNLIPNIADIDWSLSRIPMLSMCLLLFMQTVMGVIVFQALFVSIEKFTQKWRNIWLQPMLFIFAGIVLTNSAQLIDIPFWIIAGIIFGCMWYLMYRYFFSQDGSLLWIVMATVKILQLVPSVWFDAYPGILFQFGLSSTVVIFMATWIYAKI